MSQIKKKTVLMLLDGSFPPDVRVEKEINVLKSEGYSIIVCCTKKSNKSVIEEWNDIKIYREKISNFIYKTMVGALKFPFYYKFWKRFMKKVLANERIIDIVHAHDLVMVPVALELVKHTGAKLVIDFHENYPYLIKDAKHTQSILGKFLSDYRKWERLEKEVVKEADVIIAVVEEMKQRIVDLGAKESKVHIYQNVIDLSCIPDNFKINSEPTKGFNLVYVGGITPARGLSTVVKAITLLLEQEKNRFKLTVCGTGSYEPELRLFAKEMGVFHLIDFCGWVNQADVFSYISKGNAAIIPHYRSIQNDCSSPNKLYQYMLINKPVISSDCKSLKRIIESNNSGLIYKDNSPQDLSEKIQQLMNDKEIVKSLGENGRLAVVNKYNTNVEKRELIKAYSNLE